MGRLCGVDFLQVEKMCKQPPNICCDLSKPKSSYHVFKLKKRAENAIKMFFNSQSFSKIPNYVADFRLNYPDLQDEMFRLDETEPEGKSHSELENGYTDYFNIF